MAIVSHNSRTTLGATLDSLERARCPRDAIVVLDVASTDGTSEWLASAYPGVHVERLSANDGPNPARNLGIRNCSKRFVFLMDADVQVQPGTVQRLYREMTADSRIKIGSPIVVYLYAPDRIQYAECTLHFICEAINPWQNRSLAERGPETRDVGVAPACGLLIDRQAAIEIGLFDERYFMGKDDGDFTHRMRLAGYRIVEPPDALVLHQTRPRSTWLFYYQIRNRWHFMLKNYQLRTLAAILPCLAVHESLQLVMLHAKGYGLVYWKAVGGLLAMLPALPKDRAFTRRIRAVTDGALLKSDALVVRDELAGNAGLRSAKRAYEGFLRGYWRVVTTIGLVA